MKTIAYEQEGDVVVITMNRPQSLNAMNNEMIAELSEAWRTLESDPAAKVGILTAKGRAYCVGFDMKEISEGKLHPWSLQTMVPQAFSPRSQSKPVIAAVNGPAVGAGFDFMAMDADLVVAAERATFSMPEAVYGMASLGSPFATAKIPRAIAMEIVLTGDAITAPRAYETGFVNRVVPESQLMTCALRLARKIASNSPEGVRQSRRNLLRACEVSETARIEETFAAARADMKDATAKGVAAFVAKVKPEW